MKIAIFTHVFHSKTGRTLFAYGPYVREMNIWNKYATTVVVVAPVESRLKSSIDLNYKHESIRIEEIKSLNFQSFSKVITSIIKLPSIFYTIFKEIKYADHIHLRCPGNIGLIACLVQILFPLKQKSAKYAGNWDPKSKQPLSYRIQKWILSNTFLTKNITVLVYGDWPKQSANIKAFFTATYDEIDKIILPKKKLHGVIRFLFVGTLSEGKRPLYALQLVELLYKNGVDARIDFYGEGYERSSLENYIHLKSLEKKITIHGNQKESEVRKAYQNSHFLILPSKSEGWPKVVAEAMFWGVVPISSAVSCVPYMLDFGSRGVLLDIELEKDIEQLKKLLDNESAYAEMSRSAKTWSQEYTIDKFENEIKHLLN